MTTVQSPSAVLDALRWRYSTKQFDPSRRISAADWDVIEQTMVLTPSSFGLQPWKFLVVDDAGTRAALQPESWNQTQVTEASHFVVFCARTDLEEADIDTWISCLAAAQGRDAESLAQLRGMIAGFTSAKTQAQRHEWNVRQVYIALGQLMACAAMLGIDACPMEGINPVAYDRLLGLETSGYATVVACALGYRAETDKYAATPKARFDRSAVISHV